MMLPSGQDVAHAMQTDALTDAQLDMPGGGAAPLWYDILKEAEMQAGGEHLGEAGGRVVADVFFGLMEKDPSSYLRNQPNWQPFLGTNDDFTISDLIAFANHGMDELSGPGADAGGSDEDS